MPESVEVLQRADSYVRGELDQATAEAFEAEMLESEQLQDAVEVALALQKLSRLDQQRQSSTDSQLQGTEPALTTEKGTWQQWSLAASVVMVTLVTGLLWQSQAQNDSLQSQIAALSQPVGNLVIVPMDIMRSLGARTPEIVIRRPAEVSILALELELDPRMADASNLNLSFSTESGEELVRWQAAPGADGRLEIVLPVSALPDGKIWLSMFGDDPDNQDKRLLELLPAE